MAEAAWGNVGAVSVLGRALLPNAAGVRGIDVTADVWCEVGDTD